MSKSKGVPTPPTSKTLTTEEVPIGGRSQTTGGDLYNRMSGNYKKGAPAPDFSDYPVGF